MKFSAGSMVERVFGGKFTGKAEQVVRWQLIAAGFLALQAVAIIVLSTGYALPVSMTHLTRDTLQTQLSGSAVAAPALSTLFQINIAYIVAAMLVLTAVVCGLLATVYKRRYIGMIKDGWQPVRWLVVAIAGTIMIALVAFLGGVHDILTLGLLKTLVVVASVAALMGEVLLVRRVKPHWLAQLAFGMGAVAAALAWLITLAILAAGMVLGNVTAMGYLWWLLVTVLVGGLLVVGNMVLTLKKRGKWANYVYSEYWFVALIVAVETVFAWQVFAAVLHP